MVYFAIEWQCYAGEWMAWCLGQRSSKSGRVQQSNARSVRRQVAILYVVLHVGFAVREIPCSVCWVWCLSLAEFPDCSGRLTLKALSSAPNHHKCWRLELKKPKSRSSEFQVLKALSQAGSELCKPYEVKPQSDVGQADAGVYKS